MKKSNNLRRLLPALAATFLVGIATFAGCTKVDDTLGSNIVPEDQQMKAGYVTLDDRFGGFSPRKFVETRLFQTDSIIGSNITYGYMGSMASDTFGIRTAGFLTQYVNYYIIEDDYFGYAPIFDSAQILLSIDSYGSDTTTVQSFEVYEVLNNDYITEKPVAPGKSKRDTTFYLNFYPEEVAGLLSAEPLFTFELGGDNGPSTEAVTMTPTAAGRRFIRRLMLQEGTYKDDYSIYASDNIKKWIDEFKGLYIKPARTQQPTGSGVKGTIYATTLSASGFSIYGRNRVKENPSLIKDTIGMIYYFYDSEADYGNVSVNTVRHDYGNAKFDIADARETNKTRPENTTLYVAGMGGVISELTFTQEFFDALQEQLDAENARSQKGFDSFAFSQVQMSIYFWGSSYEWEKLPNIPHLVDQMNVSQKRLGLYTDYKHLSAIPDYAYLYEKSYDLTLAYDGYINRSRGCYVMDITGYMQELWNSYRKEAEAARLEGRAVDLNKVEKRSIYLAPEAYDLFTEAYSVVQGESGGQNNAPIRIDLTYNMIK